MVQVWHVYSGCFRGNQACCDGTRVYHTVLILIRYQSISQVWDWCLNYENLSVLAIWVSDTMFQFIIKCMEDMCTTKCYLKVHEWREINPQVTSHVKHEFLKIHDYTSSNKVNMMSTVSLTPGTVQMLLTLYNILQGKCSPSISREELQYSDIYILI